MCWWTVIANASGRRIFATRLMAIGAIKIQPKIAASASMLVGIILSTKLTAISGTLL